ncbi:metallophosphoesterase, partial [Patescibacteria group bacterium]|nr:metallophosphoesterase [Patescibacteria group bacterium]
MRLRYLILSLAIFIIPAVSQATSVSYDGCWEQSRSSNIIHIRALSLTPQITLDNSLSSVPFTFYINLENVDPDLMVPNYYDQSAGITKGTNSIIFEATIKAGELRTITIAPFIEEGDDYYFVAMSDNQATSDSQIINPVFSEILDQVEIVNPLFMTNSGDLVKGSGDQATLETMFDNFKSSIDALPTTYLTIPGNHEYNADFTVYEEYLGNQYYSFDYNNTHFTAANTAYSTTEGRMVGDEFTWFQNDLSSTNQPRKIAFFHHAVSSPSWGTATNYLSSINRDQIAEVVDDNRVDIVINGHNHGYDYRFIGHTELAAVTNGFYQLVTGGAGGAINEPDGYYHYTIMHVTEDGITPYPIRKSKFEIAQTFLDNNDGTEESVTLILKNNGSMDIPYLRPKFKLSKEIVHLKAVDDTGNYYEIQSNTGDDYTVAYVETDLSEGEQKNITVSKADELHEDLKNIVYKNGSVSYDSSPTSQDSVVNLKAQPNKNSSEITIRSWGDNGLSGSWTEKAGSKYTNTTYTFSNLRPNTIYTLKDNNSFYKRFITDSDGNGKIKYTKDKKNRTLSFSTFGRALGSQIVTGTKTQGASQIRRFDEAGDLKGQFYAYGKTKAANYTPFWMDAKGDGKTKLLISRTNSSDPSKIKLFTKPGKKLASKMPFGKSYNGELEIIINDINQDQKDEIIIAPKNGGTYFKIFKYNKKKGNFKLIAKEKYSNSSQKINIGVGQVNGKGNKEIIITPQAGNNNWLKVFKLTSKNDVKLLKSHQFEKQYFDDGLNITVGSLSGKAREEIILSPAAGNSQNVLIFKLK